MSLAPCLVYVLTSADDRVCGTATSLEEARALWLKASDGGTYGDWIFEIWRGAQSCGYLFPPEGFDEPGATSADEGVSAAKHT